MNLRVPLNAGNLSSCKPVSFSRRTLHHGVSKYNIILYCIILYHTITYYIILYDTYYNIIFLTTVLQLPTLFSTVTCCTGL